MIYVLAGSRPEAYAWARSQGLAIAKFRFVQNAQTLPGVLNPRTTRLVQLPGWAKRRDVFAVKSRLKNVTRRAKIEVEVWKKNDTGDYYRFLGDPVPFDNGGALPAGPVEAENTSPATETVVQPASFDGADGSGSGAVARNILPSAPAEKATEPVDFVKKRDDEITEVQDAVEQTRDDLDDVAAEMDAMLEESKPEEQLEKMLKPKRVRRTNAQIAYDTALVDWESNGGAVEAVHEARAKLKKGDPRLAEDPTAPDDLDF